MSELLKNGQVIEEISPNDRMHKGDPDNYFYWGGQALELIERFRAVSGSSPFNSILDLPSGHGRVMRYLRAAFPHALITACDVDRDAVDFCARTFDALPLYSTVDLGAIPLQGSYDLIWCGSLLTHLPADQWPSLLRLFSQHLSRSGLLIFTTHGRYQADRLRAKQETLGLPTRARVEIVSDYIRGGFGYQNSPDQDGYGISLSSPSWVCSQIVRTTGLGLVAYQERGWGQYQDAVACASSELGLERWPEVREFGSATYRRTRVEILDVQQHLATENTRGYLDHPKPGATSPGFSMTIQGWVLRPGGPPQAIQIGTRIPAIWTVPLNMERPDLVALMPLIPDAANSGFRTQVSVVSLPRQFELPIQARFADGSLVTVATIKGRREALGGEPDPSLLRPLMITTLGRTGSTRAVQLLSHHPSIVGYRPGAYEPRIASYWVSVLAGLAEPVSHYQALDGDIAAKAWWLGVGRVRPLPYRFLDASVEELQSGASIEKLARFCRTQINEFYERVTSLEDRSEPTFFVEKVSPGLVPNVLWDLYPNSREIFLVRDMRDMVSSMLAFNAKRDFAAFGRASAGSDEDFIRTLRRDVVQMIDDWRERLDRTYLLRYEDLIVHPETTISAVLEYLGFEANDSSVRRLLYDARAMAEPPDQHRTSSSVDKSVGRWREDLNVNLQRACDEAFGDLLPVLGYE